MSNAHVGYCSQRLRRTATCACLLVGFVWSTIAASQEAWRLAAELGLPPDRLALSGSFMARYESLSGQYRAGFDGGDQALMLRTLVFGELKFDAFGFAAEVEDARQQLADRGTPINGGIVNTAELLQAYVRFASASPFVRAGTSVLRLGRLTMDVGSRRLVARVRFRNTYNGFTGADWQVEHHDGSALRAFYALPVQRLPGDRARLLDNDAEFDAEHLKVRLWGLYYRWPVFARRHRLEVYVFGLDESDTPARQTLDGELYTFGGRYFRAARTGAFDFELESVLQVGESRATMAASDRRDLDHFAHFHHFEIGYSFDQPWSPQLMFQYDYASGDREPGDGDNERFNTLYGARRFDFGPPSLYGPFARSNVSSPGLRLRILPHTRLSGFVSVRGFWLASDRDAWTPARVRDSSGAAGSFLGTQVETQLRWEAVPKNLRLEAGLSHVFEGEFMRDAPNATRAGDITYVYFQTLFSF